MTTFIALEVEEEKERGKREEEGTAGNCLLEGWETVGCVVLSVVEIGLERGAGCCAIRVAMHAQDSRLKISV